MWRCLRAAVCWTIFEERNRRICSDRERRLPEILELIQIRVFHWLKSLALFKDLSEDDLLRNWKEIASSTPVKDTSLPSWAPPPSGFVKLNFDGSSMGNPGPSGIGGVLRNEEGMIISLFSGPIGLGDSLKAEISAVIEGTQRAIELNITNLVIEGNSKLVVDWLRIDTANFWSYNNERRKFNWLTKNIEVR
ncbi:PREDICTED: uncharacterized protein LOC109115811 [Nelumbo nucifera]|uniref:Uncharacterized protein LOC109115811 n=1 Tax=Nelumbo nucifera TaxID=4432 RepID=A0A1U8QC46_NELNU|nr:PREDICTED: uncharacterized protein LOC109115811 [Nelumbo nucifera]